MLKWFKLTIAISVLLLLAVGFAIGYFLTYVVVNAMNAAEKVKEMNNYLKAQTTRNPSYEGEKTL
ncbi:hypothetical protein LCGC14_2865870, partial [marine sediment metagenome]